MIMKLSLWDLKPNLSSSSGFLCSHHEVIPMGFETISRRNATISHFIMKLSLWDLKPKDIDASKKKILYHEVIPMGFETSTRSARETRAYDHEVIPMGFETISMNYLTESGKTIMKLSLWDLKPRVPSFSLPKSLYHEVIPMGFETSCLQRNSISSDLS